MLMELVFFFICLFIHIGRGLYYGSYFFIHTWIIGKFNSQHWNMNYNHYYAGHFETLQYNTLKIHSALLALHGALAVIAFSYSLLLLLLLLYSTIFSKYSPQTSDSYQEKENLAKKNCWHNSKIFPKTNLLNKFSQVFLQANRWKQE